MKIFGFEFGKKDKVTDLVVQIKDVVPDVDIVPTGTKSASKIKQIQAPTLIYQHHGGLVSKPSQRRNVFDPPEYDLYEINRIADVESYVRQAFKKQVGLFLKEGFDYVSRNKRASKYIKTRFTQIAKATNIPHTELIRRLANNFISKSNAFLIKVRKLESSGGKVRTDIGGKELQPVAGYFLVPPETMEVDTDGSGKARAWRQRLPNGTIIPFKPEDVVHFTFDKKEGFTFGTPLLVPVIDDIRTLRKIEENIELLVSKHLFPIFQYIVGTETMPAGTAENGMSELEIVKQEIQYMPSEGSIVTPERHEIKAIGAESKALRAEGYLEHFKKRVFAGLGMSAVDYGEGDTVNKSTSDNLSRALIDTIKDLQDAFEAQFNQYIIEELLAESNFEEDMTLEENKVEIVFREIDIDKQIKVETHAADMFAKNIFQWDETRELCGRDPILIPDDPEEFDVTKFPEWNKTFWKLFEEPGKLIQSLDEVYSAKAAAKSPSTAVGTADIDEANEEEKDLEKTKAKAKAAAKPAPKKRKDSFLVSDYETIREIFNTGKNQTDIKNKLKTISIRMTDKLRANTNTSFIKGLGSDLGARLSVQISIVRREIHDRSDMLIRRLLQDIENTINHRVDINNQNVNISVNSVLDSFRYRLSQIEEVQIQKAYNLGRVMRAIESGIDKGKFIPVNTSCDECKSKMNRITNLREYSLINVLPHHPHCECSLEAVGNE